MGFHKRVDQYFEKLLKAKTVPNNEDIENIKKSVHTLYDWSMYKDVPTDKSSNSIIHNEDGTLINQTHLCFKNHIKQYINNQNLDLDKGIIEALSNNIARIHEKTYQKKLNTLAKRFLYIEGIDGIDGIERIEDDDIERMVTKE